MQTVSKPGIIRFPIVEGIKFNKMDFLNTRINGDDRTWRLSAKGDSSKKDNPPEKDIPVYIDYRTELNRIFVYGVGSGMYPRDSILDMLERYKVVDVLHGIADALKLPLELSPILEDDPSMKRLFKLDDDDSDEQQFPELRRDVETQKV